MTSGPSETEVEHSAGPWQVRRTAVYDTVVDREGLLIVFKSIEPPEKSRANLRVIVAAPDLLAAANAVLAHFMPTFNDSRAVDPPSGVDACLVQLAAAVARAKTGK